MAIELDQNKILQDVNSQIENEANRMSRGNEASFREWKGMLTNDLIKEITAVQNSGKSNISTGYGINIGTQDLYSKYNKLAAPKQEDIALATQALQKSGNQNATYQDAVNYIGATGSNFQQEATKWQNTPTTMVNGSQVANSTLAEQAAQKQPTVQAASVPQQQVTTGLQGQAASQQVKDYAVSKGLSMDAAYNELASSGQLQGTGKTVGSVSSTAPENVKQVGAAGSYDAAMQRAINGTANEKDLTNLAHVIQNGWYTPNVELPASLQGKVNTYITSTEWGGLKSALSPYQLETGTYKDANGDIFFKPGYNSTNINSIPREATTKTSSTLINDVYKGVDETRDSATKAKDNFTEATPATTKKAEDAKIEEIKNSPTTTDSGAAIKNDLLTSKEELDKIDAEIDKLYKDIKGEVDGEASDSYIRALTAVRGEDLLQLRKRAQSKYDTALTSYNMTQAESEKAYERGQDTLNRDIQLLGSGYEKVDSISGLDPSAYTKIGGQYYKRPTTVEGGTDDIKEYQFAKTNGGFTGTFMEYLRQKSAASKATTGTTTATSEMGINISPVARENTSNILKTLEELTTNIEGVKGLAGASSWLSILPGTNTFDAKAKLDTLKDSLALGNIDKLKGAMSDKDLEFLRNTATSLKPGLSEEALNTEIEKIEKRFKGYDTYYKLMDSGKFTEKEVLDIVKQKGFEIYPSFNNVVGDTEKALSYEPGTNFGQCGEFVNKTVGIRVGNTWDDKKSNVNKFGYKGSSGIKVGDVIYQDTNSPYGHVAVVTDIDSNGNAIVSESNWNKDEKVTQGRLVNKDSIYGYIRPTEANKLKI
jgi:hypothetical protein